MTFDASAQSNPGSTTRLLHFLCERTIIDHGAPQRFESSDRHQHFCSKQYAAAGGDAEPALPIVSARKRIDELEEKDERWSQPFFPEMIGPQRGHNGNEIQALAYQLLVKREDNARYELDVGIEKEYEPGSDELPPLF